ncbi:hypothetical protein MBU64_002610 [Enterococcus faecalis]|nr:hypothetical protein [Enterococcus faecalis]
MKKLMIVVVAALGCTLFSTTSEATENEMHEVTYDLSETDTKTYEILNENDE